METIQRGISGIQLVVQMIDEQTKSILDLTFATSIQFIFKKPDKSIYSVSGSLYTNGSDGKLQYTTTINDFSIKGIWKFQVSYTINGYNKISDVGTIEVIPNLSDLS